MQDRVGEDFNAMVLTPTKYGLFVELDDLFIEGLVPIQSLGQTDGDYYTYRENTREIIGQRWGRKFTFGQKVRVVLDRVDARERRLQFSILDEEAQQNRPAQGKKQKPRKQTKSKRSMQQQSKKPKKFPVKKKRRR
jgi:ribonuclease R